MKKMLLVIGLSTLVGSVYAEIAPGTDVVNNPTIISWISKDQTDEVTINNGTATPINITITVAGDPVNKLPGIHVKNCGKTTHVDAGSSAICGSSDPNNPVSFSAEDTKGASGTYQIKPVK